MRRNPLNKGIIMENAAGVGSVTPAMVEARARELALINGHGSTPNEADWEEAKRELTGEEEIDPQEKNSNRHRNPRIGIPCPDQPDAKQRIHSAKMKIPRGEARLPKCTKKASMKRSTIKCFAPPRRTSKVNRNN